MRTVPGNCILYLLHNTAGVGTSVGTSVGAVGAVPGNCVLYLLHNTAGVGTSVGTSVGSCHSCAMGVSMSASQQILHLVSHACHLDWN